MKKKSVLNAAVVMLTAFVLWTAIVCFVDVKSIGPETSSVGLATINGAFHKLTGVNMVLYNITDWLSIIPIVLAAGFALLGLVQLIKRKSIRKVDFSILALGGFYAITVVVFALFEIVPVNYRPVLIEGVLEASYPSSTTMLVMCIMPTAAMQLNSRINNVTLRRIVSCTIYSFTVFMVIARLISGVHWLTDIIGGALFSAGLVLMYGFVNSTHNFQLH